MDNYSLWEQREDEMERWLKRLPCCYECNRPIQDEMCFEWDGLLFCEECTMANHRRFTDDFIT